MLSTIQIVSIEGNIGSGKSTLLTNLKKYFSNETNIIFLREPVDEWSNITDENGVTILEKFYADQNKYAFSFQMMAYISRLKLLKDAVTEIKNKQYEYIEKKTQNLYINFNEIKSDFNYPSYVIITERSLYTDKMVFAKMLYDSGKIENVNYQIYLNWFNEFTKEFPVNKIIYVRTDPEICHQRISIRSREGENNIPLDYLKSCDAYHEAMLDKTSNECVCKCQLMLNGNNNIYEKEQILHEWIDTIQKFIINI
jgi:deoxyadenosine/deoxycytidine kinase